MTSHSTPIDWARIALITLISALIGAAVLIAAPAVTLGADEYTCPAGTFESFKTEYQPAQASITVPSFDIVYVGVKAGTAHRTFGDGVTVMADTTIAVKAIMGHDASHAHWCKRSPTTTTTAPTTTVAQTTTTVAATTTVPATTTTVVAPTTTVQDTTTTVPPASTTTTLTAVTGLAPQWVDPTCDDPDGANVITQGVWGINYTATAWPAPGATVTINAEALPGYRLVGETSWTHTYPTIEELCTPATTTPDSTVPTPTSTPPTPSSTVPPTVATSTVPPSSTPTTTSLSVVTSTTVCQSTTTTATPTPSNTCPTPDLPDTGGSWTGPLVLLAGLLTFTGSSLVLARRRR